MEAQEQVPGGDAHEIQVVCIGDSLGWIKQEPKEIAWEVQEKQNEEPFVEVMVESPEAEDIPLDVWQRPLPDESPLERGRKARLLGGCRIPEQAERDGPGGNSEASELRQMSPRNRTGALFRDMKALWSSPRG
ncbi:hypothetical protein JRQ81_012215 [Phrynocephalus forsythii]|uniref:Uncharacterized protein n=1 Tax=Phrynocephalus forsythii TaxID=171643 RepID=A0A9Q0X5G2_9SAUR|nr:hypothetical protein JRQ81_012215 [Phrynocephalus forsythii]